MGIPFFRPVFGETTTSSSRLAACRPGSLSPRSLCRPARRRSLSKRALLFSRATSAAFPHNV
jgi:hypothetical protein